MKTPRKYIAMCVVLATLFGIAIVLINFSPLKITIAPQGNVNATSQRQGNSTHQLTAHYEGLALYRDVTTGKVGFLDESGNVAIPAEYDHALFFENGVAIVKYKGTWGVISSSGEWVFGPNKEFSEVHEYLNPEFKNMSE